MGWSLVNGLPQTYMKTGIIRFEISWRQTDKQKTNKQIEILT